MVMRAYRADHESYSADRIYHPMMYVWGVVALVVLITAGVQKYQQLEPGALANKIKSYTEATHTEAPAKPSK